MSTTAALLSEELSETNASLRDTITRIATKPQVLPVAHRMQQMQYQRGLSKTNNSVCNAVNVPPPLQQKKGLNREINIDKAIHLLMQYVGSLGLARAVPEPEKGKTLPCGLRVVSRTRSSRPSAFPIAHRYHIIPGTKDGDCLRPLLPTQRVT